MRRLEALEELRDREVKYSETNINQTFGQAYFSARRNDNNLIDFNEVIWDYDVDRIIENCAEFGIREFTISSTYSGLIEIIAAFDAKGWKIAGVTEVNAPYCDFMSGEHKVIPAFRMVKA